MTSEEEVGCCLLLVGDAQTFDVQEATNLIDDTKGEMEISQNCCQSSGLKEEYLLRNRTMKVIDIRRGRPDE